MFMLIFNIIIIIISIIIIIISRINSNVKKKKTQVILLVDICSMCYRRKNASAAKDLDNLARCSRRLAT